MSLGARDLLAGRTVALGDLAASVRASDLERAEAITAVVGVLPSHTGSPHIELEYGETPPEVPTYPPSESHGPLRVWRAGDELAMSYEGRVSAVATSGGVVAGGSGADLVDAWRYIFHFALPHVLALHDRFVFHAGGIVSGDRAVLVFGESGAGKSTLVLAALDAGWTALSDDLVILRRNRPGPEACGIGKPFRVPGDVLDGALDGPARHDDDPRRRLRVDGYCWDPGWFPVHSSILLDHGRESFAELEPLAGPTMVEMVLRSFVALTEPQHVRRCFPLAAAVGRCGGYRLSHSADASTRLAEAARALDVVAGETSGRDGRDPEGRGGR